MAADKGTTRTQRGVAAAATAARIEAAYAKTRAIVATGRCPHCGSGLRRNLSLSGWWQCEQLGASGFRARPSEPPCDWQGFTE